MGKRSPCNTCRIARRKCSWLPEYPNCERCRRLRQPCYESPSATSEEHEYSDGSAESNTVDDISTQISELYADAEKLQSGICYMGQKARYIRDIDADEEKCWDLIAVNGVATVTTPIHSVPELFEYCRWSLHYLPVFAGVLDQDSLYFKSVGQSMVHKVYQFVPRTFAEKQQKKRSSGGALQKPIALDYRLLVNQLVEGHVLHQKLWNAFIHLPSYVEHYRALKNPLDDPITMALCATSAMRSSQVLKGCTIFQRRQIAEYFYQRSRTLLLDMFDDHSRRLETVATITILYYYVMLVKFQFHEARRLSSISYMLCNDLKEDLRDPSVPLHQRMLFQRYYFFTLVILQALEFSLEGMVTTGLSKDIPQLVLPTEAEAVAEHLLYYHYLQFLSSPHVNVFWEQLRRMVNNEPGTYRLEAILYYRQNIVADWWDRLPDRLRLCKDPFSDDILDVIDRCTCSTKLLLFALLHESTMTIHGTLLNPAQNGHAFMGALKQYIVTTIIHSTECLIYALQRVTFPENIIFFSLKFSVQILHSLTLLAKHTDSFISSDAQNKFNEWLQCSFTASLPKDHCTLSSSTSIAPIFKVDNADIALETDRDHPLPGYAFFHDLVENSMQYLSFSKR